jgi:hypothetical protein
MLCWTTGPRPFTTPLLFVGRFSHRFQRIANCFCLIENNLISFYFFQRESRLLDTDFTRKDRLAAIVRSVNIHTPGVGGNCLFRALCGYMALKAVGIETIFAADGMLYRAGHDPILDVVGFAGRDFGGTVLPDGRLLGHFWLSTLDGNTLIDFSPGDWQALTTGSLAEIDALSPHERPIEWLAPPSDYFWGPVEEFKRPPDGGQAPPLGKAWYLGWSPSSAVPAERVLHAMRDDLINGPGKMLLKNVYRWAREETRK